MKSTIMHDYANLTEKKLITPGQAIEALLNQSEWVGWHPNEINRGRCEEFAVALQRALGRGRISWLFGNLGNHAFLEVDGRYYDVETPNGVENVMDLEYARHYPDHASHPENVEHHDEMRKRYLRHNLAEFERGPITLEAARLMGIKDPEAMEFIAGLPKFSTEASDEFTIVRYLMAHLAEKAGHQVFWF